MLMSPDKAIRGGSNGHAQECSPHAKRSRGNGARRGVRRHDPGHSRAQIQHEAENRSLEFLNHADYGNLRIGLNALAKVLRSAQRQDSQVMEAWSL
jgi:hypothetical protein